MKQNGILTALFAFLLLSGGLFGYFLAHSTASLVSSSISSLFLFIASLGMLNRRPWAVYLALTLSILLAAFFAFRFAKNPAFMPLLLSLASLALAAHLYYHRQESFTKTTDTTSQG